MGGSACAKIDMHSDSPHQRDEGVNTEKIIEKLNREQRQVALSRGHCLAVACPGSGKTSTLASKAAMLLNEGLSVAAVTFTKESALELRKRIVSIAEPGNNQNLIVGTFHSVDLLMAFPRRLKSNFGRAILQNMVTPFVQEWDIVSPGIQYGYVQRAIRSAGLKIHAKDALKIIEEAKDSRLVLAALDDQHVEMVDAYNELLTRSGKIDFQDIILKTNEAIRNKTLSTLNVDHLLVDEFQDVDSHQYEWVAMHGKAGVSITCVGDDDQSIYAFRRALGYEGMERFGREFGAERILLGTNYRCRSEILGASEKLISRNTQRIDKRLFSIKGEGGTVVWESFQSSMIEASAVAEEASVALEEGATFAAIARTNRELIELQKSMLLRNIPFKKADGKSIFDCPEVQVFAAMLRAIIKPEINDVDQILAWAGMVESDIAAIHKLFGNSILAGSLSDFKNSEVTEVGRKIWQGFAKLHSEWMSLYRKESFAMINFAVHEWLLDNLQAPNSDHFLAMAASLFDPKGKSLKTHLANLKLAEQKMQQSEKEKDDSQKVAWLMTAHGSKGLEFDRVWIVGLQNGAFPSEKSSLEEERRLMFVAMTRAREALWISASAEKQPSIFIQEAGLQKSNVVSPYGE
jgi:DNA helicase-2/ATP-dependent DNA helicase PcrA